MKHMKKIVTVLLLLLPVLCFSQTRPHWLDINGKPALDVRAYGAKGDGITNDSAAVSAAMVAAGNMGEGAIVVFPSGDYLCNSSLSSTAHVVGIGNVTLRPWNSANPIFTLTAKDSWWYGSISNIVFKSKVGEALSGIGVTSSSVSAGRMEFNKVRFEDLNIGMELGYGNIGLSMKASEFKHCQYGLRLLGQIGGSHAGCVLLEQVHFQKNTICGFYYHDTYPTPGQILLAECVFEINSGTSIFINGFKSIKGAIRIESPWFEDATTHLVSSPAIEIDGFSHRPSNIVALNSRIHISDTMVETLIASNSTITLERCSSFANGGGVLFDQFIDFDSNSSLEWTDYLGHYKGEKLGKVTTYARAGVAGDSEPDVTLIDVVNLPLKHTYVSLPMASSSGVVVVAAEDFASSTGTLLSDALVASFVAEGIADKASAIWDSTSGFQDVVPRIVASMPLGTHYYAWSINIKKNAPIGVAGIPLRFSTYDSGTGSRQPGYSRIIVDDDFPIGEWRTIGGVFGKGSTSGGTISLFQYGTLHPSSAGLATSSFTVQGFQVVAFPKESDALSFINSPLIIRSTP